MSATRLWLGTAALLATSSILPAAPTAPPLKAEISDVATLSPTVPHRFVTFGFGASAVIYDGDSGKIEGQLPTSGESNVAIAPDGQHMYVGETLWTHGNRGSRVDLLSVYDTKTLTLQKEIELPGRALVVSKVKDLDLSPSGKRAYVYNMHPASSVVWVDLAAQKVGGNFELPGCALVMAWGEAGVSSLCGDGSLASTTVTEGATPKITHSKPFFDAANDPIFDNVVIDHASDTAQMMTYTGQVYSVRLGAEPVIEKPWSIQAAAGFKAPGTGVDELAWRPGGAQPFTWHIESGRLFVLMHTGNYWSHAGAASEIWVLNAKTHALLNRYAIKDGTKSEIRGIAVTQKAKPQLVLVTEGHGLIIVDADTGEEARRIDFGTGDLAIVPGL